MAELRGKVVLVDFWTYSCINCQRTFPFLTEWHRRYADDGLVIVGVHSPEFAFEKVEANVADAAARFGIEYPIALDNDFATWVEWDQAYWPAHYLIDRDGVVRQVHFGEGAYAETELLIQELLDAPATPPFSADEGGHTLGRSPETYLGSERLIQFFNDSGEFDVPYAFTLATDPPRDTPTLGGTWTITPEHVLAGDDAVLAYRFFAADVFLVLGGEGTVRVTRAGDPDWENVIDVTGAPTLYTLYSGEPIEDLLTLEASPGIEAYAFTFG
jgi:thiol-disulfide isomerase/thioredoxin